MSDAEFLAGLTGSTNDLALAVKALRATRQPFCLIGRLAVNHYVEPMVTLDADFAVVVATGAAEALRDAGFNVVEFPGWMRSVPNPDLAEPEPRGEALDDEKGGWDGQSSARRRLASASLSGARSGTPLRSEPGVSGT